MQIRASHKRENKLCECGELVLGTGRPADNYVMYTALHVQRIVRVIDNGVGKR